MERMRRLTRPAAAVALAVAAGSLAAGCGGGESSAPTTTRVTQTNLTRPTDPYRTADPQTISPGSAQRIREYWTPERLRSARPLPIPGPRGKPTPAVHPQTGATGPTLRIPGRPAPATASAPAEPRGATASVFEPGYRYVRRVWKASMKLNPARTLGKVFFVRDDGNNYVCSGAVVNSENRSVVWTAGHCVFDREFRIYHRNWVFVPGYRNGQAPFGIWPAKTLATTSGWSQGSFRYDLGAAVVVGGGAGSRLAEVVGAQGLLVNARGNPSLVDYGWPSSPPFSGERLYYCLTRPGGRDDPDRFGGPSTYAIGCDMTPGCSGGPWLVDYRPSRGWGYVFSVNSYLYGGRPLLFGPYQGRAAVNLYNFVRRR